MMLGRFALPETLARFKTANPGGELSVTVLNHFVAIVEEGFDLAVRAGRLPDSSLIARKAGSVQISTVASSAYLSINEHLQEPGDLARHNCLTMEAAAHIARWPFRVGGAEVDIKVSGDMRANDSHCLEALALTGLGIVRLPRINVSSELAAGTLTEILPRHAPDPARYH